MLRFVLAHKGEEVDEWRLNSWNEEPCRDKQRMCDLRHRDLQVTRSALRIKGLHVGNAFDPVIELIESTGSRAFYYLVGREGEGGRSRRGISKVKSSVTGVMQPQQLQI